MSVVQAVKQTAQEFVADGCMSSAAALAYYSIFAIPALVVLIFALVSYAGVPQERIQRAILDRLGVPTTEERLNEMTRSQSGGTSRSQTSSLRSAADERTPGPLANIGIVSQLVGVGLLLFTATGLFAQLQTSLNRAWGVEPDPGQSGAWRFVTKRLFSLLIIVGVVLLLLASVLIGALMNQILAFFQDAAPTSAVQVLAIVLDHFLTFLLATLLFALIFRVLPDVNIAWRDLWVGAASTALLFVVGKLVLSLYLQNADFSSGWGPAAGSVIAVLAWFYYTSLIVLFGAEFTQIWARNFGNGFRPTDGARWAVADDSKSSSRKSASGGS